MRRLVAIRRIRGSVFVFAAVGVKFRNVDFGIGKTVYFFYHVFDSVQTWVWETCVTWLAPVGRIFKDLKRFLKIGCGFKIIF
jgi:hypothetical protein